jgi:hypothetical protein
VKFISDAKAKELYFKDDPTKTVDALAKLQSTFLSHAMLLSANIEMIRIGNNMNQPIDPIMADFDDDDEVAPEPFDFKYVKGGKIKVQYENKMKTMQLGFPESALGPLTSQLKSEVDRMTKSLVEHAFNEPFISYETLWEKLQAIKTPAAKAIATPSASAAKLPKFNIHQHTAESFAKLIGVSSSQAKQVFDAVSNVFLDPKVNPEEEDGSHDAEDRKLGAEEKSISQDDEESKDVHSASKGKSSGRKEKKSNKKKKKDSKKDRKKKADADRGDQLDEDHLSSDDSDGGEIIANLKKKTIKSDPPSSPLRVGARARRATEVFDNSPDRMEGATHPKKKPRRATESFD